VPVPLNHPPVTPLPPPVVAEAPGEATAAGGGLRVTFATERSDLNPTTEAALRDFVRSSRKGGADPSFNVLAYATGVPEDPSTPRRLSLARALAARSVLIAEGVPSTRIYVRALGATSTEGPPDRVDVVVAAPAGAAAAATKAASP